MTSFLYRCRQTVDDPEFDNATAVDGAQHLVLIGTTRVWRFPRHDADCDRLGELADRNSRARHLGLGAPEVLAVVNGPPAMGHVLMSRVDGTPLLRAIRTGAEVGRAVLEALTRLDRTSPTDWPFPQMDWTDLWENLADITRQQQSLLPRDEVADLVAAAEHASAVAREAPVRLVHGDLASDNIMVDTDGSLAGLLDWDGAVLGDPAIDIAAALHGLPRRESARLIDNNDWLAPALSRWSAYRDTWPLQDLLWRAGLTPPLWDATAR